MNGLQSTACSGNFKGHMHANSNCRHASLSELTECIQLCDIHCKRKLCVNYMKVKEVSIDGEQKIIQTG